MSDDGIKWLTRRGIGPGLQPLVLTFGIVGVGLVVLGAYRGGEWIRVLRGGHSDAAHVIEAWDGTAPIARDVNGDGLEDIIGVYAGRDPGGMYLGAFDGKSGRVIWRHGPIVIHRAIGGNLVQFGLQGERLLVNEHRGGIVLGLRDGAVQSKLQLPAARQVCAGDSADAPLVVETQRADAPLAADLATGKVQPLAGRRICQRTMTSARAIDPATVHGDKVRMALTDGAHVVAFGSDSTVRGHADPTSAPKWTVPLALRVNSADLAAGRLIILGTDPKGSASQVIALDAERGAELWRSPLDASAGVVAQLSATKARVYVTVGEYLLVLDAGTGKLLRDLGLGRD
ncbi:MAG: PQQ-like beta-propeller repeat protein [Polyangiaceae bacterium]|nr:PQQ-like beta-propeller repeat protein [Polyangiaceae bacterium]